MSQLTKQQINGSKQTAIVFGAFKGLISSIPFIGGPIIGAWEGYRDSRIDDTIKTLSSDIKKLGKEKIDMDYIESEEFIDLLNNSYRTRLQHRSKEKAKFICGLLIESVRKDRDKNFSTELKEKFLYILEKLSDEDMIFLNDFINEKYKEKSLDDIYQLGIKESIAIDSLLANNLLRQDSTWDQHVVETALGRKFIDYLKILAREDNSSVK